MTFLFYLIILTCLLLALTPTLFHLLLTHLLHFSKAHIKLKHPFKYVSTILELKNPLWGIETITIFVP